MKQIKTYSQFVNEQKTEYSNMFLKHRIDNDIKKCIDISPIESIIVSLTSDEYEYFEKYLKNDYSKKYKIISQKHKKNYYLEFRDKKEWNIDESINQNIFNLPQIFQLFYDIEFDEFSGDITESEIRGLIKSENLQKIKLFSRELAEKIRNNEDSINKRNNVELLKLKYLIKSVIENLEDKDYLHESATIETISFEDVKDEQRGHGTLEITFDPSSREYSYVAKFENGKGDFRRPNEISGKWDSNDDLYNIRKSDILQKFKEAKVNESNEIKKPTLIDLYSEFIELPYIVKLIDKYDLQSGYKEWVGDYRINLIGDYQPTEIQKKNIMRVWKELIQNQQYEFKAFGVTFEFKQIFFDCEY